MSLTPRPYQSEADYWRIRDFLRRVFLANHRREWSWQAYRWDYWRWHVNENIHELPLHEIVTIWETTDGTIAAVLHPEDPGEAHFQIDPAHRTPGLEAEMLAVAELTLTQPRRDGSTRLLIWAHDGDPIRPALLEASGYTPTAYRDHQRRRPLDLPIPDHPVPPGYILRALGAAAELPARSWLSWRAFHPEEPDDKYEGWEWYQNVQRCPLYRRQLDLLAVALDSEFAAFCTVWFDDVTRAGSFEPVGVHPDHQRRGLGKAVMTEGLRRLQLLGATQAHVSSYTEPAHRLYHAMGFVDYDLSIGWLKETPAPP